MTAPQDCQAEACAIQTCLTKNNYDEAKCQSHVFSLYKCCSEMYAGQQNAGKSGGSAGGDGGASTACPIESVVKRKMKQFQREGRT